MFSKLRAKLKKKDDKELESNPVNDLFHSLAGEKEREQKDVPDHSEKMGQEFEDLEEKKRKRYEAIKKKYRDGY